LCGSKFQNRQAVMEDSVLPSASVRVASAETPPVSVLKKTGELTSVFRLKGPKSGMV
jgi:hypothetical protein